MFAPIISLKFMYPSLVDHLQNTHQLNFSHLYFKILVNQVLWCLGHVHLYTKEPHPKRDFQEQHMDIIWPWHYTQHVYLFADRILTINRVEVLKCFQLHVQGRDTSTVWKCRAGFMCTPEQSEVWTHTLLKQGRGQLYDIMPIWFDEVKFGPQKTQKQLDTISHLRNHLLWNKSCVAVNVHCYQPKKKAYIHLL